MRVKLKLMLYEMICSEIAVWTLWFKIVLATNHRHRLSVIHTVAKIM